MSEATFTVDQALAEADEWVAHAKGEPITVLAVLASEVRRLRRIEQRAKEVGENEFLFYDTEGADMVASFILGESS